MKMRLSIRHRLIDDRLEVHEGQDVLVDVDARRDLDQLQTVLLELEDAALGHVIDRLLALLRDIYREKVVCSTELRNFLFRPS